MERGKGLKTGTVIDIPRVHGSGSHDRSPGSIKSSHTRNFYGGGQQQQRNNHSSVRSQYQPPRPASSDSRYNEHNRLKDRNQDRRMVGLPDDYKPQKNNASFKTQSEFGVDAYRDQAASKFGESRSEPPNAGFLYSPRTRKDLEAQRMRTQNIEVDEDARKAKAAAAAKKKALAATLKMSRTAAEIERDLKLKKVFDIARDEDDVEDESSQWLSNASRANSSPFFTSSSFTSDPSKRRKSPTRSPRHRGKALGHSESLKTPASICLTSGDEQSPKSKSRTSDSVKSVSPLRRSPRRKRNISVDSGDEYLLQATQMPSRKVDLCPFCSSPMPEEPSRRLLQLRDYLLNRPNIVEQPSVRNPGAMRLPVSETATFCRMHAEEAHIVPDGIAQGWPASIDWGTLPCRIRKLSDDLRKICQGELDSEFLDIAKKLWAGQESTGTGHVLNEIGTFHVEQPGYYGARGFEIMLVVLTEIVLEEAHVLDPSKFAPLDEQTLIRQVLIPETALRLIKSDLQQAASNVNEALDDASAHAKARKVLEDSRAYGRAMFPSGAGQELAEMSFVREMEMREREELRLEREARQLKVKQDNEAVFGPERRKPAAMAAREQAERDDQAKVEARSRDKEMREREKRDRAVVQEETDRRVELEKARQAQQVTQAALVKARQDELDRQAKVEADKQAQANARIEAKAAVKVKAKTKEKVDSGKVQGAVVKKLPESAVITLDDDDDDDDDDDELNILRSPSPKKQKKKKPLTQSAKDPNLGKSIPVPVASSGGADKKVNAKAKAKTPGKIEQTIKIDEANERLKEQEHADLLNSDDDDDLLESDDDHLEVELRGKRADNPWSKSKVKKGSNKSGKGQTVDKTKSSSSSSSSPKKRSKDKDGSTPRKKSKK